MSTNVRSKVSYGLSQPYFSASPQPIVAPRDPFATDYAEIGTEWINSAANHVWILASVVNNVANWMRADNSNANAGINWNITPGVGPVALAANNGYYLTNAAAVALTLPATASLGSQVLITTADASAAGAGFTIAQNAGQYILYNDSESTAGVGGSLDATAGGAGFGNISLTLQLICTVANTEFTVFTSNFVPVLH
jgi:hypothetical protein